MIYLICESGTRHVKIGYTKSDPKRRLQQLQLANPHQLTLIFACEGSRQAERDIHHAFEPWLIRGEWFRWSLHIVVFVCTLGGDDFWRGSGVEPSEFAGNELTERLSVALSWERALANQGIFEEPGGWIEWLAESNAVDAG